MNLNQYRRRLKELENLLDQLESSENKVVERTDKLLQEISRYEKEKFTIGLPTPAGAIKFRMEQAGYTQTDLADLIGSRSHASELLRGKRNPSKRDALIISKKWGIPLEILLQ